MARSSTAPRCGTGVTSGLPVAAAEYQVTTFRHIAKIDVASY